MGERRRGFCGQYIFQKQSALLGGGEEEEKNVTCSAKLIYETTIQSKFESQTILLYFAHVFGMFTVTDM